MRTQTPKQAHTREGHVEYTCTYATDEPKARGLRGSLRTAKRLRHPVKSCACEPQTSKRARCNFLHWHGSHALTISAAAPHRLSSPSTWPHGSSQTSMAISCLTHRYFVDRHWLRVYPTLIFTPACEELFHARRSHAISCYTHL